MARDHRRQHHDNTGEEGGGGGGRGLPRVSAWKKVAVVCSVLVALAGVGLWAYAQISAGDAAPAARGTGELGVAPQGFLPGGGGGDVEGAGGADGEPTALEVWSPAIFRLGFSFFAAFCIAYALRAFLKMTIVVIGAALLGLFGLQYAGVIDVNWGLVEGHYETVAGWVGEQTRTFTAFVSGYLPSAASATAGFVVGFGNRR